MQNNILDYLELTKENLPEKIAYCDSEGESITFLQLYKDVRTIGSYILDKTSESNKPIVVFTERNIKSISSFLGVTYSGNFYIPVDATLPDDRLDVMLELSDPLLVINCTDRVYNNNKYKIVHCSDILASKNNDYDKKQIMGNDPLYGIFTSGSTGLPKLVVKNHMSLISFIDEYTKTFNFNKTDILGNQIPFYFDASTKDLFTTLKVGCTTNIIHKSYFAQPGKLAEYIENNNITSICWVPSALNMLSMFNVFTKYPLKNITRVLFVGEAMHVKQLNIWINALPWAYFVNLYGSTENAGNCLYHIIKEPLDSDKVPIGKPFDNAKIFLLDDEDKLISPTDTDSSGEICVAGILLALGYYKNIETTNEKFCQNPLNDSFYERIFRTGDVAKYDTNGNIVYLCRKDYQIKVNGCRIELSEIDNTALALDNVTAACSIYDETKKKIVLFYSANNEMQDTLLTYLKKKLPTYMVPGKIIYLENMPLNANGKIHRTKLKELYSTTKF